MYRLLGEPLAERPIATGFIRQKEVGGFR
jgi:hypothetical protein